LELDRRWQVFGGQALPGSALRHGRPIAYIVLAIVVWIAGSTIFTQLSSGRVTVFGVMTVGGSLAAGAGIYLTSFRRPKSFIALAPEGLIVFRDGQPPETFPWSDVGRARYDIASKSLMFPVGKRRVRLPSMQFFHWYIFELDRCVRAINRYPRPDEPPGAANQSASRASPSSIDTRGS